MNRGPFILKDRALKEKATYVIKSPFMCIFSYNKFGNKAINCRWNERKQYVIGRSKPMMHKEARERHVGHDRSFDKIIVKKINSFLLFTVHVEC